MELERQYEDVLGNKKGVGVATVAKSGKTCDGKERDMSVECVRSLNGSKHGSSGRQMWGNVRKPSQSIKQSHLAKEGLRIDMWGTHWQAVTDSLPWPGHKTGPIQAQALWCDTSGHCRSLQKYIARTVITREDSKETKTGVRASVRAELAKRHGKILLEKEKYTLTCPHSPAHTHYFL